MRVIFCALVLLALTASGCGSGDDGSTGGEQQRTAPVVGQGLPPEVRNPVASAIGHLQRSFADGDYDGFCAWVTPTAAREAGEAAHGDATTCERDVRRLFGLIRKGGGWRHVGAPRVIDVRVDGASAIATVALDRRWQARIALARSGGRWRLNGLFGAAPGQARGVMKATAAARFPAAGGRRVTVSDATGRPCPDLSDAAYPVVAGGCRLRLSGRVAPLTILTALGDFEFEQCSIAYEVRVDAAGRTWTEEFDVGGPPKGSACGDVNACYYEPENALLPWRGRLSQDGRDGFVHRMDMCLRTCVGYFVGELIVRLRRDGNGWRADPVDGGGPTGFRFDSPLTVRGGLDVAPA